jgi:hypothetical protein
MKRVVKILGIILMVSIAFNVNAQTTKQERKEAKVLHKEQQKHDQRLKNDLYKTKTGKDARKAAKKLQKEGWKTLGLPMEKQIEEAWMKQSEKDASGFPRYIVVSEKVTAQTFVAGQMMCENMAKIRIAGAIATEIGSLATEDVANGQLTEKEAASVTKVVEKAKVLVEQKLGRMIKPLEIYRPITSNNNVEVRITMAYDMRMAMTLAQQTMIEELKKELKKTEEELNKLMCLDKNNLCSRVNIFDEVVE